MRRVLLACVVTAAGCDGGASSGTQAETPDAGPIDAAAVDDATPLEIDATPVADGSVTDAALQEIDAAPPPACPVSFVWDPRTARVLETFPDDYYTRPDPATVTGLRPDLGPERAFWLDSIPGGFGAMYRTLERLDGWGTSAGIILRFSGPVAVPPEGAVRLMGPGPGSDEMGDIAFDAVPTEDGTGLILWPRVPLRPASRHAVVVTNALRTPEGRCVSPSPALREALAGVAPLAEMGERFREALDWAGLESDEAVAVAAFTTQSIVDESVAIAADIEGRAYTWSTPPSCTDMPLFRECEGTFTAQDYRGADGIIAGVTPVSSYELVVRAWLPLTPAPSRALVLFGPGLGADLDISRRIAEITTPLDVVTVSIDAPAHGRHPIADPACMAEICRTTDFFGVDLAARTIDVLVARDHLRESTYDKLQLLQLLRSAPEIDGDGTPDLDPTRIAYFAASLGGIMGPEFLALSPHVSAGLLNVPGGRIASIMDAGQATAVLVRSLTPAGTTPSDRARLFPLVQTLLERGDPVNYAPHVLADRLPGAGAAPPHLLVNLGMSDRVIPTVATRALARALHIPHVPPVLQDFGLASVTGDAPVVGNLGDGATTAGLFQFDRGVRVEGEPVAPADHDIGITVEGRLQITHFLRTWAETGRAEIIDPYAALETPPLP